MSSVDELDSLAESMYANPDPMARQESQQRLSALTQENADVAPLQAIFAHSSNQYALMFVAQGAVTWFRENRRWLSDEQQYEVVVNMCGTCVQRVSLAGAPRHVMLALMSAYAKLTKLCFEKGNFLVEAVTFALQMLHDASPAYARHVAQNGGCGSTAATAGGGSNQAGSSSTGGGGASSSAGLGGSSEGGDSGPVGYTIIRRSRFPSNTPRNDEERRTMYYVALLLLSNLVTECSKYDSSRSQTYMNFSVHRRCSNNFRDECMLDIFAACVDELEDLNSGSPMVVEVTELVRDCMTYDFMAIMVDETEEALSSQFPSTWKEVLLAPRTWRVLWGQHAALPYPHCTTLLTGLTSLCGIRRTFFESTEERVRYLDNALGDLGRVLELTDGRLKVPHYVTVLAEACHRFVSPFGYRDLHLSSMFQPWVSTVRALSIDVFSIPFGQSGSFTTATNLLSFWGRLATSRRMFSMSEESPKDLELISPELVLRFFEARVRVPAGKGGANGGGGSGGGGGGGPRDTNNLKGDVEGMEYNMEDDDDFEATMESILAQSDAVATLALLEHTSTMELLATYVNHQLGPSVLQSASATAWLFYIAGALVRHVLSSVEDTAVAACSSFFVFCIDCANHRRSGAAAEPGSPLYSSYVERSVLHFLTMVQSVLSSSRLHEALNSVVTNVFQSRASLFQFMLNNTGHNIMRGVTGNRTSDEETAHIIRESIELVRNACADVPQSMLAELHLELPPVVDLPLAQSAQTYKMRTNLQMVLWRLSSVAPYSTAHLQLFLQPIELCMQNTLNGGGGNDAFYTAGWMRDLRGVVVALRDCAEGLSDFVEWVCDHASSFHEVLHRPAAQHSMVIVSFLRFLEELVTQMGGRCTLACCTAHNSCGLMLFKHLCSLIQAVIEQRITDEHIQRVSSVGGGGMVDGAYDMMLKPLALSLSVLRKSIQGGFVPLGAMAFYHDETYDNVLLGLLRMVGVFPYVYFKEYPKTSYAVVNMLRTVTEEFAYRPLTRLDAGELEKLISFVVYFCEDVDTQTGTLLHGLSFLSFVAGLIREVKALATQTVSPALEARPHGTPPPSPMQLPSFYASPSGRLSGTPGGGAGSRGGVGGRAGGLSAPRATRMAREALARTLEPFGSLWERLIAVAMNVIVCQDRALSVSCAVVYPIFEVHPPFWQSFVDSFVLTYPERKQPVVREALSALAHGAESQDKFFSEVFTFRQTMRNV